MSGNRTFKIKDSWEVQITSLTKTLSMKLLQDKWEVTITSLRIYSLFLLLPSSLYFLIPFQKIAILFAHALTSTVQLMEGIEFNFQTVNLPKNGFSMIEKQMLAQMGLLQFATQVQWEGKMIKEILQKVLLNLQIEAKTSLLNDKTCELIPLNYRELFGKIFHLGTSPCIQDKNIINQLIIERATTNKGANVTSAMCKLEETKTILKFVGSTFSLKQKTGEVPWALVQEMQLAMKGEPID